MKNFIGHKWRCLQKQNTQTAKQELLQQLVVNDQFEEKDPCASIGTRSGELLMRTTKLMLREKIRPENLSAVFEEHVYNNEDSDNRDIHETITEDGKISW